MLYSIAIVAAAAVVVVDVAVIAFDSASFLAQLYKTIVKMEDHLL